MNAIIDNNFSEAQLSDESLVGKLPGFNNAYATVNNVNLHYVEGGSGEVLVLLPGWPETWWSFHKIMPALATKYHVIAIDLRGMGNSDKPANGYEKEQMAKDVVALMKLLGHKRVNIAGHDIGASVAFSFAANNQELTNKLIIMDTPPPDEQMYKLPMLPVQGYPHPWWVAFNQVKVLPEKMLAGRMHYLLDWIFDNMLADKNCIDSFSRAVYSNIYDSQDGIRASNAWYQAFTKDIEDFKAYSKLKLPVLGIGGTGFNLLEASLPGLTTDLKLKKINDAGHFIQSEKPDEVVEALIEFIG